MRLIQSVKQMAALSLKIERQKKSIGVVPTMGALHEGHLSLIRKAVRENDVAIVTVFVNPLQFGPREDFARYPRSISRDLRLARSIGAHVLFAPTSTALYPDGFQTYVSVERLADRWEGIVRPGHFRGVATVVLILFELTRPTRAYFGQKDYQQMLIVEQLVHDLHLGVVIRRCPIVREPDGLAMSSRNQYLSADERSQASVLFQALQVGNKRIERGERRASTILEAMRRLIRTNPSASIDYLAIVDAKTLMPQRRLQGRVVLLVAVWMGKTRLIDNFLVDVP